MYIEEALANGAELINGAQVKKVLLFPWQIWQKYLTLKQI